MFGFGKEKVNASLVAELTYKYMQDSIPLINEFIASCDESLDLNKKREVTLFAYVIYWLAMKISKLSESETQVTMLKLTALIQYELEPCKLNYLQEGIAEYKGVIETKALDGNLGLVLLTHFMMRAKISTADNIEPLIGYSLPISKVVINNSDKYSEFSDNYKVVEDIK